ncbi:MAG: 1-(5-phosphoribosyl)-5-((5-phosphoribosylamino)methylideneamino)imidazole-4-carboxamide isomerase [Gammaproteobacteria bacterium]|nr:MAG: 1-(5-phosphoribosyl)-5-((5-phosphoribosylamino)methylideneamino)imidazole-4-carboxamide isomerase [Gammaproteobacteria bacterium]
MIIIPAIDLKDGACVRLRQGLMSDSTVFAKNPVIMADKWVQQGAERLHLVDLDGAFAGKPKNQQAIEKICHKYPNMPIQIGGGIRDITTAEHYFKMGISYCIIGTAAIADPEFVKKLSLKYPQKIILGIDAKNGMVATDGWAKTTDISAIDLALSYKNLPISAIVYTDISRDGMMQGLNIKATAELARQIKIPVIASGGMTNMADIKKVKEIEKDGVSAVIIGRALYEGTIDLPKALGII